MRRASRILEDYLVASARLGDRTAFTRLVELRGPRLLSHATRLLGNREEARDAVQEAWVDIFRGLRALRDPMSFPAWSMRIVTRKCGRLIDGKASRRRLAQELTLEAGTALEDGAGDFVDASDATKVRAAIDALPPGHAATIALFYLEDMSVVEVAIALDVPVGTIKTRLMHARSKLKHILTGDSDE
uniref:RNA polymerase sigma factor n=1 Tax=Pararhizobium sp. IMCC3301 TaxID=3067904 RepID=UPI002740AE3C|nr:sigma-70 family RNA polymerase sigma factor [Pararhizobium sp. IMCC3301]